VPPSDWRLQIKWACIPRIRQVKVSTRGHVTDKSNDSSMPTPAKSTHTRSRYTATDENANRRSNFDLAIKCIGNNGSGAEVGRGKGDRILYWITCRPGNLISPALFSASRIQRKWYLVSSGNEICWTLQRNNGTATRHTDHVTDHVDEVRSPERQACTQKPPGAEHKCASVATTRPSVNR
jgi:hypothetical protein